MARPAQVLATALPFLVLLGALALSVIRFRAGDSLGGLASGLGGMLAMIVLAVVLPAPERS